MKGAAALAAIACLLVAACGPFHRLESPAAVHVSPGAIVASAERSPSPLPSPSASPPVASNAACRIPMAFISEAYGWFLNYPGGGLTKDASSQVALPGNQPG